MRKLLLLIIFALLVAIAVFLFFSDIYQTVSVRFGRWDIETTPLVLCMLLMLIVCTMTGLLLSWFWFKRLPKRMQQSLQMRKQQKRIEALKQGLIAFASGDLTSAKRALQAASASDLEESMTLLLSAQIAQLEHDSKQSHARFTKLLAHQDTRLIGLRGLLLEARTQGRIEKAIQYAEEAYTLNPKASWVSETLLGLYLQTAAWKKAEQLLDGPTIALMMDPEAIEGQRLVVCFMLAKQAYDEQDYDHALHSIKFCYKRRENFIPFASFYAAVLIALKKPRQAKHIIERAWEQQPHHELATLYETLIKTNAPAKQLKILEGLCKSNADHYESHKLLGKNALNLGQYSKARIHLKAAYEKQPTFSICQLLIQLEEKEGGGEQALLYWKNQLLVATPDSHWLCQYCGNKPQHWTPQCHQCHTLQTIFWTEPLAAKSVASEERLLTSVEPSSAG